MKSDYRSEGHKGSKPDFSGFKLKKLTKTRLKIYKTKCSYISK